MLIWLLLQLASERLQASQVLADPSLEPGVLAHGMSAAIDRCACVRAVQHGKDTRDTMSCAIAIVSEPEA